MEKATKAIRRSSTKLRGLSSRHSNLQVLIGQLGDMRTSCKGFIGAQQTAADDLVRWTNDCDNRAIQDTCAYLSELSLLWTEVQKEFSERLREHRTQFELILEGERHVDQSREMYAIREQREIKCRKELDKSSTKGASEEVKLMEERVIQAEKGKDLAYYEVVDRMKENEAVKLIRFREGLRKMSSAYVSMAEKCQAVFGAYHDVACTLPDVHEKDLQQVKYTGNREASQFVQRAKEQVLTGYISSSFSSLPRSNSPDSCSKQQPQFVALPSDQSAPQLPPKNASKHEEATGGGVAAAVAPLANVNGSGGGASGGGNGRHDPPPSYSSVVGEDSSDAASVGGACGFTPTAQYKPEESSGPIQVSYPAHLNPQPRSQPRNVARASAPIGIIPEEHNISSDSSHPYRALARSVSDRRMVNENRNSLHPVLRKHETNLGRPYSEYSDYSDVILTEGQLNSLKLAKPNKKFSLKSLSTAGNSISEFLGINGNYYNNVPKARTLDSDYEPYDFTRAQEVSSDRQVGSYNSIHGVLAEEIKSSNSQSRVSLPPTFSSNSSSDGSSTNNEKHRALSAKFAMSIPFSEDCREELSPSSNVTTDSVAVRPGKARSKRHHKTEKRTDNISKSASKNASSSLKNLHVKSSDDINEIETENQNKEECIKEETKDLIDLNESNGENAKVTKLRNSRNLAKEISGNSSGNNNESNSTTVHTDKIVTKHDSPDLDGDLARLAQPRNKLRSTNPFYESNNSDESESDTSNSASMNR